MRLDAGGLLGGTGGAAGVHTGAANPGVRTGGGWGLWASAASFWG